MSDPERKLVDISGLDKTLLLHFTWIYAKGCSVTPGTPAALEELASFLHDDLKNTDANRYIDYYHGRPIKIDFSCNLVDPSLFNRDASLPFHKVVEMFRQIDAAANRMVEKLSESYPAAEKKV